MVVGAPTSFLMEDAPAFTAAQQRRLRKGEAEAEVAGDGDGRRQRWQHDAEVAHVLAPRACHHPTQHQQWLTADDDFTGRILKKI